MNQIACLLKTEGQNGHRQFLIGNQSSLYLLSKMLKITKGYNENDNIYICYIQLKSHIGLEKWLSG